MDHEEGVLEGHTDDELALLDPLKLKMDCVSEDLWHMENQDQL